MELDAAMKQAMEITGAVGVCLVDYDSGMTLGALGGTDVGLDLEVAAAGNTEVVRAKQNTMKALGLTEKIEDILITLNSQYPPHPARLVAVGSGTVLLPRARQVEVEPRPCSSCAAQHLSSRSTL